MDLAREEVDHTRKKRTRVYSNSIPDRPKDAFRATAASPAQAAERLAFTCARGRADQLRRTWDRGGPPKAEPAARPTSQAPRAPRVRCNALLAGPFELRR